MNKENIGPRVSRWFTAVCLIAPLVGCNVITTQLSGAGNEDAQGARAAKSALMASASINAAPLRVSKRGGLIQLSGYVESEEEKQEAEAIIRKLYPDASIKNTIQLR